MEAAQRESYPVYVVDGSPEPWAKQAFEERGAIVLREEGGGMGAARRQVIRAALEDFREYAYVWMEPEKAPLVPLLGPVIDQLRAGYSLVLPRRKSLDSYPKYQQYCELKGNWLVGNMLSRPDLDLWFGPRAMDRHGARLFIDYDGEYGDRWDSIFIPVARAVNFGHCSGSRFVASVLVDYRHPAEQTAAETGDEAMDRKRDTQLAELLAAMQIECQKLVSLPRYI